MTAEKASLSKGSIDWVAIKTEYVAGADYTSLSEKYGVKEVTIRQRVMQGKWGEIRNSTLQVITERAIEKIIDVKVDILSNLNEIDLSAAQALRDKANEMLSKITSANELKSLAGVFDSAQKISRLALGASTENNNVTQRVLEPLKDSDFLG